MKLPKVTIQIVTWNSLKYLPFCLKSIFSQTYRDFQVLVIDNNSQDGTVDFLRKNYPDVTVFQNKKNLGFAKANNQGIKLLTAPCIVLSNPDIIMEPTWLERIMAKVDSSAYKDFGSFGGKLLKFKIINADYGEFKKTDIIDSCGLKIYKNHRVGEIGAGQTDWQLESAEVFGHSAALVLYRREALTQCLYQSSTNPSGEYFDEDFFFYKEDVDLAWRLQLRGWKSLFVSGAVAYHVRSLGQQDAETALSVIKNRKHQSAIARQHSYRNHWLVLIKNESIKNLFKYFPFIFWYEFKKFVYILIFEWSTWPAFGQVLAVLPKMLKKRRDNFKKAKATPEVVRQWIN